ncbi:MAG: TIM barrel protein [Devosia sp.]|uniref:TIM barrel protein n=1 Tax=Devosia sp. TaxID=1871048 RepID=UPI001AC7BB33|nr:TIM barrel protein [Devosia sp.]MBN9315212.1 TIM barrel protein [Devosia sp.]
MTHIIGAGFNVGSHNGEFTELEADMRALADMGVDTVEIGITSLDLVAGGRIIRERHEALVGLCQQFDFRYTVHGLVSSNFMDPVTQRYQIDAAKALIEVCNSIGAEIIVQHSGSLRADAIADWAGADEREREALTEVADFARPHGVRIALENIFTTEPGQYRQTPSQVAATVRAVNHPNVVALIDFSHAYIEVTFKGLDFFAEIGAMAPVAGHLHVHDSFGRPQGFFKAFHPQENTALGIGDLHMPLGWGDIGWDRIFSELTFLPETVLMMEIGSRYRREQPASLARARELATLNAPRAIAAE